MSIVVCPGLTFRTILAWLGLAWLGLAGEVLFASGSTC